MQRDNESRLRSYKNALIEIVGNRTQIEIGHLDGSDAEHFYNVAVKALIEKEQDA